MSYHNAFMLMLGKISILLRLGMYTSLMSISCNIAAKPLHQTQRIFPDVTLFQYGSASALLSGAIEGDMTYHQLQSIGDFGLGTFNGIDGEMVALDGNFYKISQKGKTIAVHPNWKTPFVELVKFTQNNTISFHQIDHYEKLKLLITPAIENKNIPYAIKVTGTFQYLKLRSRSPRPALQVKDVIEETYTVENMKGTLVGFWFPDYLMALTVPEFHFHFIADNKMMSGHVLDLKADSLSVAINQVSSIEMMFPKTQVYKDAKMTAATLEKYHHNQMNNTH